MTSLQPLPIPAGLRVAIAHEWVAARAGSEKVFEAFAQLFPTANLFALTVAPGVELELGGRRIRTTRLDQIPVLRERRSLSLPLMPAAWKTCKGNYDLVITSSHAFARSFPPARTALHLSYIHTPARYLWSPEIEERHAPRLAAPIVEYLKRVDRGTIQYTDAIAANSSEVAARITRHYGRQATVIPPPVDVDKFRTSAPLPRSGLLCFGRWIGYKRFDLAIRAAGMANERLTVAGRGPLGPQLKQLANRLRADVDFIDSPSDGTVRHLMATHRALLFPGREDFGIVPVEASAAGLPTLALDAGGARDTVEHGRTGLLVGSSTPTEWVRSIRASREMEFSDKNLRSHAQKFDYRAFRENVWSWLATQASDFIPKGSR